MESQHQSIYKLPEAGQLERATGSPSVPAETYNRIDNKLKIIGFLEKTTQNR